MLNTRGILSRHVLGTFCGSGITSTIEGIRTCHSHGWMNVRWAATGERESICGLNVVQLFTVCGNQLAASTRTVSK